MEPVDKGCVPPCQSTHCAPDSGATFNWSDSRLLTGKLDQRLHFNRRDAIKICMMFLSSLIDLIPFNYMLNRHVPLKGKQFSLG